MRSRKPHPTATRCCTSTHAVLPTANPKLGYDAVRDFAPIGLVARAPNVLIASPSLPAASVGDLVALAKARPGTVNFASSGNGTITHLIGEMFRAQAGIQVVHIPYRTGVQAVPDVMAGGVAYLFDSIVWSLPQIRAGKLKGLAVTSLARSPLAPEIPTVAESGLPGFEGVTWFGLVAPAGTPRAALDRLGAELRRALEAADVREQLARQGAEAAYTTPEAFAALIRADTAKWARVIREAGVKFD
jgi:tripartite-type tricarboxylate transporter receptor subunit TctC